MTQADSNHRDQHTRPKRRWLQYRLRTVLIVMTVVAVALAWWSHSARRQRDAVAALRKIGADIEYDRSLPWIGDKSEPNLPPCWPQWLLKRMGEDYFARVHSIQLARTQVTDGDLAHLQQLGTVRGLFLFETRIGDGGLQHIKYLRSLEVLNLESTNVTDAGLAQIGGLSRLERLFIKDTQVTDAGLEHLTGHTTLRNLCLPEESVTAVGVARLQKALPNCQIQRDHTVFSLRPE